ncbi:MAG: ABC transporter ATP-binding protein, partial [Pseudomonadota bacterium]|nr:ABC transporter ATP-binding protein [Pseudomonadota bacterium]
LQVERLDARYGQALVLEGVSLAVRTGTVCLLLGRNGAGKSTTVKSLIGLVRPAGGAVRFLGHDVAGEEPYRIARRGMGYVPEERRIFTDLTVMENLQVGTRASAAGMPWTPERLFALFPNLAALTGRPGGRISGGEQQMLAIARTLMGNPRLLLLDEPSEGLAPVIVRQVAEAVRALKAVGVTSVLAEQNLRFAEAVADRAVILERGRVAWRGTMRDLADDAASRQAFLSV